MIFTLEALQARHGDALLLHWGDANSPRLGVIDGGPSGVYRSSLHPRLSALRESRSPGEALGLDLVMVSHIDDDHIHGILDLTNALVEARQSRLDEEYAVNVLWHNSFDDLAGPATAAVMVALPESITQPASADPVVPAGLPLSRPAAAVVASVAQGRALRDDAERLGIPVNRPFAELVQREGGAPAPIDFGQGVSLSVLGPSRQQVDGLRDEWREQVERARAADQAAVAEFLDKSVFNLSSIVVFVETADKSMLLTGDARGDFILESLEESGLAPLHVDLFKLPHHGSDRNVAPELFERVIADHYVISGDGGHHNPEVETLRMLTDARDDDDFAICLTNRKMKDGVGEEVAEFFDEERSRGRRYEVRFRDEDELAVRVDLGERLMD